jgi:phosphoglycerate kinase
MTMASSGAKESLSDGGLDLSGVRTIEGVDVKGKRVLVRVDFNVPIENGVVADATRLERVLPTISRLAKAGAKVIVLSHLGRPKGVISPDTSLWPVAEKMRELMPGTNVHFIGDCFGEEARRGVAAVKPGEVAVLENVRYYSGEEKNDLEFAKALADLGEIYVNDAFSAAHRAHASIEALAHLRPAYAGLQLMAEVDALGKALENPARPVMAIVGGAKVSTKIEVLTHLVTRMDQLAVGGGMANTFLAAKGIDTGASLVEPEFIATAKDILARAEQEGCEVVLPTDVVVAKEFKPGVDWQVCPVGQVPADAMILDFGPKSVAGLKRRLAGVKTVLWNGPLGAF